MRTIDAVELFAVFDGLVVASYIALADIAADKLLYSEPFGPFTTYEYPCVDSEASVYGNANAVLV